MYKYWSRVTSSARGEAFNPLLYPALIATFIHGVGFAFLGFLDSVKMYSLYAAMASIGTFVPVVWGLLAVFVILIGLSFLLFNIPPAGKASGLAGFMLWIFASACWVIDGGWFIALAIGVPNLWFWIWQYLTLARFGKEVAADEKTMKTYRSGGFNGG